MNEAVQRYFDRVYPRRHSSLGSLFFYSGEDERIAIYSHWLPPCDNLTVLDAGCGDGYFLERVLRGFPTLLRLEDFAASRLAEAQQRWQGKAGKTEIVATDVLHSDDARRYDIVLAIGLFDYAQDWAQLLDRLLSRTQGVLLTDMPKSGTLRHLLARPWLALQHVRLHAACRREIDSLLAPCKETVELRELSLSWSVRIQQPMH